MRILPARAAALVLAALTCIAGAVVAPSTSATAAPAITLVGSGWGHGHGLSQYGARGAAAQGLSTEQILRFYYPGTASGTARGAIAVLITADTTSSVVVRHRSHLKVRSTKTGRTWSLTRRGAKRWRLTPVNRSTTRLWVRTSRWRVVRDIAGAAEFTSPGALRLYLPNGRSADYRGRLRSAVPASGRGRDTVNIVSLEQYLRGVVPREMPASWQPAAVRAQAVAARTYAVYERATTDRGHFDVWDTTRSQVYGGVSAAAPASDAAIRATAGQIRTWQGRPAFTQFSSSNGGWTAAGSQPYLVAQRDPYEAASGNPNNTWSVTLLAAAIERQFPAIGTFVRLSIVPITGSGGRVQSVTIVGTDGRVTVGGDTFRSRFGLKSTMFRLS